MTTLNEILEVTGNLEGVIAVILIDEEGGIQAMTEERVVALIFGDERAEEPYLEVRCQLDFIMYFSKLLDIPLTSKLTNTKFKDLIETAVRKLEDKENE